MLQSRYNDSKSQYLHERCLRLIYNDKCSSYEQLLQKDISVSICDKNYQEFAIEMFKVKITSAPEIAKDILCKIQRKPL